MKIGFTELMVVFVVALLVIGPDKLPMYAKKLGEALSAFRKASDEMTRDLKESVIDPLDQAQKPLREALDPVNQLGSQLQGNMKEVETSFKNIGKAKPAAPAPNAREPAPASAAEDAEAPVTALQAEDVPPLSSEPVPDENNESGGEEA